MNSNAIESIHAHRNLTEALARLFSSLGLIDIGKDKVLLGISKERLATLALACTQGLNICKFIQHRIPTSQPIAMYF